MANLIVHYLRKGENYRNGNAENVTEFIRKATYCNRPQMKL